MKVTYASEHKWIEVVTEDPMIGLGKNNRSRLKSALNKLSESTVTHTIEPLTQEILGWFTPLYSETIANKSNPKLFDIYATTLGKDIPYQYYALSLYENGKPIGATIFSERKTLLSIAYRIYPNNWGSNDLKASPSLFTEFILNKYALDKGYNKISHGKDRNPYGVNSSIGLAMFKLSVGCVPSLPTTPYEILTSDIESFDTDILLLKFPEEGTKITEAILYASEDGLDKYSQLQKYTDRLTIETLVRPKE